MGSYLRLDFLSEGTVDIFLLLEIAGLKVHKEFSEWLLLDSETKLERETYRSTSDYSVLASPCQSISILSFLTWRPTSFKVCLSWSYSSLSILLQS